MSNATSNTVATNSTKNIYIYIYIYIFNEVVKKKKKNFDFGYIIKWGV